MRSDSITVSVADAKRLTGLGHTTIFELLKTNKLDDTQRHRQRYRGKTCDSRFDDLTGIVLAGHHQPLRV